ncbi:MAG: hypothetical protein PHC64_09390 [Candidatus Gastranaerophilales bacterium]|nr:hypothetical protein [Candidatus Gastranaerophilales bacterium]
MGKFQVQYKHRTKTYTLDIEAPTYSDILNFFNDISACEVTEIREFKYENENTIKDDGDYIKYITVNIKRDTFYESIKIPKVKKEFKDKLDELEAIIKSDILLQGLKPIQINLKISL